MADDELLWMTNPDIPGVESQVTTQEAFDLIWEAKGWELIPYGTDPIATPVHLSQADLPYLRDRAYHMQSVPQTMLSSPTNLSSLPRM